MSEELYLYGEIGFDIEAEPFSKALRAKPQQEISLRIHSPGGSVFDASTIYHAIKDRAGKTIAYVDGMAASAASFVAMAADEIIVGEQGFFMVHQPWSMTAGTAAELRRDADLLDKIGATMAQAYSSRVGGDLVASWFEDGEHWFNAEESVEVGLADAIGAGSMAYASFDVAAKFKAAPEQVQKLYGNTPRPLTLRALEKSLRETGLSRREATAAAAASWKSMHRDGGVDSDAELAELVAHIQQKSKHFKEMLHGHQRYQSGY